MSEQSSAQFCFLQCLLLCQRKTPNNAMDVLSFFNYIRANLPLSGLTVLPPSSSSKNVILIIPPFLPNAFIIECNVRLAVNCFFLLGYQKTVALLVAGMQLAIVDGVRSVLWLLAHQSHRVLHVVCCLFWKSPVMRFFIAMVDSMGEIAYRCLKIFIFNEKGIFLFMHIMPGFFPQQPNRFFKNPLLNMRL